MPTPQPSECLLRYHLCRNDLSPLEMLAARDTARVFWVEPGSNQAWAGIGCEARLTARGPERFDVIRRETAGLLANVIDLNDPPIPGVLPRLFGGFAFSHQPVNGMWADFSPAEFVLPRIQAVRLGHETWITIHHRLRSGEELKAVQSRLESEARDWQPQRTPGHTALLEVNDKITFPQWHSMVDRAIRSIHAGEMQKVVLSRARAVRFATPVDPLPALKMLGQRYPQTFRFLFSPRPGQAFFGATPELLARVDRPQVYSLALAGSIASGSSALEQRELAEALLRNAKDRHEHALVVEAIRHALQPLTSDLESADVPHVRRLANIQHLETQFCGTLADPYDIYDVTSVLHPTAAVGGAPRQAALDFVTRTEPGARGWYASPVGWLDAAGNGVFAVAIRSALCGGDQALLYAGAGIVAGSDPTQEWQETDLKFKPMMEALGG